MAKPELSSTKIQNMRIFVELRQYVVLCSASKGSKPTQVFGGMDSGGIRPGFPKPAEMDPEKHIRVGKIRFVAV